MIDARRIAPPRDFEAVLERLCEDGPTGDGIFGTKQKALMFAAALGFHLKRRMPIERKGQGIRFDVFQRDVDDPFIDILAVCEVGDLHVLAPDRIEERITIFEEYAHGGIVELQRVCFDEPGDPLDAVVRLVQEGADPGDETLPNVDPAVLDLLRT